jgi:hypothetical protein
MFPNMTAIMKLIITLGGGGGRGTLKELMVTYTIYLHYIFTQYYLPNYVVQLSL